MIQYPFKVQQVEIGNDISMAVCDEGSGKYTLLLIHGLGNYIPVYKGLIHEMKDHARCVAVDLPGNGLSSRGDYPYTLAFYAESIARLIQTMKLENVVLVGHSMGGQVAMILGLRYPDLVKKMVLLAPGGLENFSTMEKMLMKGTLEIGNMMYGDAMSLEFAITHSYYHKVQKDAAHFIKDLTRLMEGESGRYWKKMIRANIEGMLDEPVLPYLPQLQMPVLLLLGHDDFFIPNKWLHFTENAESLAAKAMLQIPNCMAHVYPHCGHFVHIEALPKVKEELLSFLR